jgi:thioesterase domain-containing protein
MNSIFFTHDDDFVRQFSQSLEGDISIYPVATDGAGRAGVRTVEGRARRVVDAIRKIQPTGPYCIAGLGANGVIAFEVATQLLGDDQQIAFLGLIDSVYDPKTLREVREHSRSTGDTNHESLEQAVASYDAEYIPSSAHIFASDGHCSTDECLGWSSILPREQILVSSIPAFSSECKDSSMKVLCRLFSKAVFHAIQRSQNSAESEYSPLKPLQIGMHHSIPLICIPGAGASVTSFIELTMCFAHAASVYGLDPRGIDGELVPHASVQAAAACYTTSIIRNLGRTPLRLIGHSFGGWVSFEMAQRLENYGREIASLTILDSSSPGDCSLREYFTADVIMECVEAFELVLDRKLGVKRSVLDGLTAEEQRELLHRCLVDQRLFPRRSTAGDLRGSIRVLGTALRSSYQPTKSYEGPVNLILVDNPKLSGHLNESEHQKLVERWRRWAPNLKYFHAPGNHMSVLKPPHVEALARILAIEE